MNEMAQVIGYIVIVFSWIYNQASKAVEGIVSRSFDAGLSIGLLVVGLIVLGWYHWKQQVYNRQVIAKMEKDKEKRAEDFHNLALQQIELSKDQIQTNKDIRRAVNSLSDKIERL